MGNLETGLGLLVCGGCLTDLSGWMKPAGGMLQVTMCSSCMVREVVVWPKPTRAERTVQAEADVALEQEQHCWHVDGCTIDGCTTNAGLWLELASCALD